MLTGRLRTLRRDAIRGRFRLQANVAVVARASVVFDVLALQAFPRGTTIVRSVLIVCSNTWIGDGEAAIVLAAAYKRFLHRNKDVEQRLPGTHHKS